MILIFMQWTLMSLFSSSDFVPFEFSEKNGFTYYIDLNDVRPGYTAGIISRGGLAGKVRRPEGSTQQGSGGLADFFMYQLATNEENKSFMDKVQKEFMQTNNTAAQAETAETDVKLANSADTQKPVLDTKKVLDWSGFESCAQKNILYLREAVALKNKIKTNPEAESHYFLIKSLLADVTTEQGFVCGQFLRPDLKIRVLDEVRNVKILTALLNRKGIPRYRLFQTLSVAFSEKSPMVSRFLFSYYFSRQFFTAALTLAKIPTYSEMNIELIQKPKTREIIVEADSKKTIHTQSFRVMDTDRLMNEGLNFLKTEKL